MEQSKVQKLLDKKLAELQDQTIQSIQDRYPKIKFNHEKCRRDIGLILAAITRDVRLGETNFTSEAGTAYFYSYNSLIFNKQKEATIYAIKVLKYLTIENIEDPNVREAYAFRFDILLYIISEKVVKEGNWWSWLAKVLPLTSLCIISVSSLIGDGSLLRTAIISTITIFFTCGVIWWWWALHKIITVMVKLNQVKDNFRIILYDIEDVKGTIKKIKTVDKSK